MPRDSAAADRPASYLVGTAAAFPLFFRDRTKPINQLPFSPSAKFPKSGSSCESRANMGDGILVYFGYPRAHEDEADRSVRAGLDIVDAMVELNAAIRRPPGSNSRCGSASP